MKKSYRYIKFRVDGKDNAHEEQISTRLGVKIQSLIDGIADATKIPRGTLVRIAVANFINKVKSRETIIMGAGKDLRDVCKIYKRPEEADEVFEKLKADTLQPPENDKAVDKLVEHLEENFGEKALDEVIKSLRKKKKALKIASEKIANKCEPNKSVDHNALTA
jgi:hypothetical protein